MTTSLEISDLNKGRLIVGLDLPTIDEAERIVSILGDTVSFYKIGYHLSFVGGLELARDLVADGKQIFLDMKLFDIETTIIAAVENIAKMGISMLTLHAYPQAMRVAVSAARGTGIRLLAVTVLTSMDDLDLKESGYEKSVSAMVEMRATQARDIGMGGLICSPREASMVRKIVGDHMSIVTPGIRMMDSNIDNQKRFMSPEDALRCGATHIVVARPIVKSSDPLLAARQFLRAISLSNNS
ncbi:orotidine-5'-phosphate decarboxylase [Candidatus Liberibacter americanus]|uniref:Orotidine 5'-phosphate decarboxylase n=1 Tax=Candidatus Liberibacter americanus str. Sao Paulo TaxID=1261131 RepID=U6B4A0_9HYPH|nr:orotidine-5'-phosphate decarboxylase [Candidatus Liberibacter americanus]AHA27463.1 Orotidine-5'-phosphate decarboxylase [Candidatus Liberibacter americanus str. Sao Paulo]EMS36576.1 orotidine 5'-phosphate decarboxylase [Candidatus Liberibacter americanus PW_SP]